MTRTNGQHLSPRELEDLHALLRDNPELSNRYLAIRFNLSERTVQRHRASIGLGLSRGRPRKTPVLVVKRICMAEGCLEEVDGHRFCPKHAWKPPENAAALMAGR